MSTGLLALLDDVVALVKASAVILDDISAQITKTSSKVSGIVIDDAAVTPKYVVGLDPARELVIIWRITRQSLVNKLLFLSPLILALNWIAPWALSPMLMLGGCYLCFEGYEKVHDLFKPSHTDNYSDTIKTITPDELEALRIKSAVTTDFILSAEIVAITYSTVVDQPFFTQIAVLLSVGLLITVAVYGFVAIIVKMDDIGLHLATSHPNPKVQAAGIALIKVMPGFLKILGYVGTIAMLWVGAEIIIHGMPAMHHAYEQFEHIIGKNLLGFLAKIMVASVTGVAIGWLAALTVKPFLPKHDKNSDKSSDF